MDFLGGLEKVTDVGKAVVGTVVPGAGAVIGAFDQEKASEKALEQQLENIGATREEINAAVAQSRGDISTAEQKGITALSGGKENALRRILEGYDIGAQSMGEGFGAAKGSLEQSLAGARSDLTSRSAAARYAILRGSASAEDPLRQISELTKYADMAAQERKVRDITGQPSILEWYLQQDPFANFEADPGYAFRQQEGIKALMSSRAAQGGRNSGAALRELMEYGQGLASQEYQNFANRQLTARSQNLSSAGEIDRMRQAFLMDQAAREANAMFNAQQIQANLANTGYGALAQLSGLRERTGQDIGQLESNLGMNLSNLGMGYGTSLANLAMGYGQNMANLTGTAYGNMANIEGSYGSNLANMISAAAVNRANITMGGVGRNVDLMRQQNQAVAEQLPYVGQTWGAVGAMSNQLWDLGLQAGSLAAGGGTGGGMTMTPGASLSPPIGVPGTF